MRLVTDQGFGLPFYKRGMSISGKTEAEPGLSADEVLARFTRREMEEIYPPPGPVNVNLMIRELEGADYIELRDGRAYPR